MSDEDALLAAIIANPDEDTPRLVYADWLQENGDERSAEFIRLQCAVELSECGLKRMGELEERYRWQWLDRSLPAPFLFEWEFRRGFPERLNTSCSSFVAHYEAVAQVVWLRSLSLTSMTETDALFLVRRQWPARWIELEVQPFVNTDPAVTAFDGTAIVLMVANWPQMSHLRRLRFSCFEMMTEGIQVLASSPHLEKLERLRLDSLTDHAALVPLRARFGKRLVID